MILGGLWHGAGWTFVLWGALHGFYLTINHGWRAIFKNRNKTKIGSFIAWTITFMAVVISWVPFRSESINGAANILIGMTGINGLVLPESYIAKLNNMLGFGDYLLSIGIMFKQSILIVDAKKLLLSLFVLLTITLLMPNTQEFMKNYESKLKLYKDKVPENSWTKWSPTFLWSLFITILIAISLLLISKESEFLYFQF
jgi:hypothetical protein